MPSAIVLGKNLCFPDLVVMRGAFGVAVIVGTLTLASNFLLPGFDTSQCEIGAALLSRPRAIGAVR
jgi:hypothetical protein